MALVANGFGYIVAPRLSGLICEDNPHKLEARFCEKIQTKPSKMQGIFQNRMISQIARDEF